MKPIKLLNLIKTRLKPPLEPSTRPLKPIKPYNQRIQPL